MTELENLEIVIDVVDSFSDELNHLLFKLGEVKTAVEAVDDINIDVDVHGQGELEALRAELASLEAMDLSGMGDLVIGDKSVSRTRHGGSGGISRRQFDSLDNMLKTQVRQMGMLSRQMTDLSESTENLGHAQRNAMSAADKASDSFDITNLRMSDLHNAMAKVVPLLLVFIGAIPAVITAFAALAAAAVAAAATLGTIGALGIAGVAMARGDGNFMEGMQEIVSDIREDLVDAFKPLTETFRPLMRDALDGLGQMFQELANMGDLLRGLTDEARAFGSFMKDFIVGTARDFALLTDAMAPVFGMIGSFLEDMDLMEALADLMAEMLPELIAFVGVTVRMIQRIVELSEGFLLVASIVGMIIDMFLTIITVGGMFNEELGVLIASALTAASAAAIFGSAVWSAVIPSLIAAGDVVLSLIGTLTGYSISSIIASATTMTLANAFAALIGVLTLGIGALAAATAITSALGGAFGGLTGDIDSATESLKNFRKQQRRMDSGDNPYRNPEIRRSDDLGSSRFGGGGQVNVNVEGDAEKEDLRNQTQNALYRLERPSRSR